MPMIERLKELASKQALNKQYRYNCICCNDRRGRLYIKRTPYAILVKCFNAGCSLETGKILPVEMTYDAIQASLKQEEKDKSKQSYKPLPEDFTTNLPAKFLHYTRMYQLSTSDLRTYQIGYSPEIDRLIIPTSDGYLARSLDIKPKWLNHTKTFFSSKVDDVVSKSIVLVEDPISCIRVGNFIRTIALLGTSCKANLKQYLRNKNVIIWLDGDIAGIQGTLKLTKELAGLCNSVDVVNTNKDPKEYADEEIKKILNV